VEEQQLPLFTYHIAIVQSFGGAWLVVIVRDFEGNFVEEIWIEKVSE